MGLFRWFLSACVVLMHLGPAPLEHFWTPLTATASVLSFMVLSGFLIQLIITEVYEGKPRWYRQFYASRALRIYAPYLVILLLAVCVEAPPYHMEPIWDGLWSWKEPLVSLYVLVMNLLLVGSDQNGLLAIQPDTLELVYKTPEMLAAGYVGRTLHAIPQTWTLPPELYFYLLAPLLLTASRIRAALVALLFVLSLSYYVKHPLLDLPAYNPVWLVLNYFYMFLWMFLMGTYAYHVYRRIRTQRWFIAHHRLLGYAFWPMILGYALIDRQLGIHLHAAYALVTAIGLPFLFALTKHSTADRVIGHISYGVYLMHYTVAYALTRFGVTDYISFWTIAISSVVAYAITRWIEEPLTVYRHRRFRPQEAN